MTLQEAAITRALEVAWCHGELLQLRVDQGEELCRLALVVDERAEFVYCCSLSELEQSNPALAWQADQWPRVILLTEDRKVAWVPVQPVRSIECSAPGGTA